MNDTMKATLLISGLALVSAVGAIPFRVSAPEPREDERSSQYVPSPDDQVPGREFFWQHVYFQNNSHPGAYPAGLTPSHTTRLFDADGENCRYVPVFK